METRDLFQTDDWKKEKHVPVIDVAAEAKKGGWVAVTVTVGKEIAHPNTTAHHIRWIEIYFQPDGEKFPCQIGRFDLTAHGESAQGPDTSTVYTHAEGACRMKTDKPGTLIAASYCNIHGLWKSAVRLDPA